MDRGRWDTPEDVERELSSRLAVVEAIHMRRIFTPVAYNEGMLEGALRAVGAQDIQVHGEQTSLLDSEYTLAWED